VCENRPRLNICPHLCRYHSHYATQRADGLFGAFIVHPRLAPSIKQDDSIHVELARRTSRTGASLSPNLISKQSEIDEQVLVLGDWYHRTGPEAQGWYQSLRSGGWEVGDSVDLIQFSFHVVILFLPACTRYASFQWARDI
jgi:FtsP/CotA-like multicopper oxidase with cupredoxin domain